MRHKITRTSTLFNCLLALAFTSNVILCLHQTASQEREQQQQQQQQQEQQQPQKQQQPHDLGQPPNLKKESGQQVNIGQHLVSAKKAEAAPSGPAPPKSNHRLVNKIKDARHRRRHRHRQRHHHQKSAAASLLEAPQQTSSGLTALESIVDEVTRAGQQPASQQQQQHPLPASSPKPVASGSELQIHDAIAPMQASHLAHPAHDAGLQTPKTSLTRSPSHSSRGFAITSILSKIMNALNVTEFASELREGISSRASCLACNGIIALFLSPLYSKELFSMAMRTVCTSFRIQSPRVCSGLVASFEDEFEYIRDHTKLSRDEICGVVFGIDCARRQTPKLFWTVPIPGISNGSAKPTGEPATSSLLVSSGETSLTSMDDAPDLFEYRKSSGGGQDLLASAGGSSPSQQSGESTDQADKSKHLNKKSAKMLSSAVARQSSQYMFENHLGASGASLDRFAEPKISSFVHITDIHIDPYYEPGSLNECHEPLCCRATSGPVAINDKRRQAGRWGDYGNCDTPVRTLRSALNRIRQKHSDAEYWLWTGDISPHDIWNITKSEALNHVRLVTKMIRDYSNGLPVFPVIGNHEAHPVNSFSLPEIKGKFSMSWLYDVLADEWSDWLPKDALETLRMGGYYKLQVRRGFRIIALNTNYCARLNPWSFYDPVDPSNQLKWLVEQLLAAELNQDKVHIIGHVPPDNRECTQAWLFNFINIVDRFKDTIVAQFYGHTHRDEWRIMYSLQKQDTPIGIQFIGPSITPFTENNPAYRVYHQDRSGYLVDAETYYFNLTEANESPNSEPNWRFSYSARKHLNMTQGMGHNDWHQYLQRLHDNDGLFDSFFKNYYRSSDVKVNQVCKAKCKFQMLSDLRLTHPYKTKPKPFLGNRKVTTGAGPS